uniref:Protein kinase domain-containing protein n=1 Tax=Seriola lalandi dorsalis TaxID=1841481 RepID=A0A3B4WMC5_SERLL
MVGDGKGAVTEGGPSGASRSIKLYEKVEQVGEGTYGQVYKARSRESGEIVNIVRLHEIVTSDYCDHDLTGLSDSGHRFSPGQIKCYMKQLLEGICYCHKNHVLHRDIKGSNLLINESGQLKLADFGLARPFDDQSKAYTNRVITLWYRPPELLLGETHYGPAIDLWSAGCILAELLLRKPILPGRNEFEQLDLVFKLLGTPTEQSWPGVSKLAYFDMMTKQNGGRHYMSRFDDKFAALEPMGKDLLRKLLAMDPSRRITAKEALDHDYFWTPPLPTKPEDLPKYPACHEFTAKKRRDR